MRAGGEEDEGKRAREDEGDEVKDERTREMRWRTVFRHEDFVVCGSLVCEELVRI